MVRYNRRGRQYNANNTHRVPIKEPHEHLLRGPFFFQETFQRTKKSDPSPCNYPIDLLRNLPKARRPRALLGRDPVASDAPGSDARQVRGAHQRREREDLLETPLPPKRQRQTPGAHSHPLSLLVSSFPRPGNAICRGDSARHAHALTRTRLHGCKVGGLMYVGSSGEGQICTTEHNSNSSCHHLLLQRLGETSALAVQ